MGSDGRTRDEAFKRSGRVVGHSSVARDLTMIASGKATLMPNLAVLSRSHLVGENRPILL